MQTVLAHRKRAALYYQKHREEILEKRRIAHKITHNQKKSQSSSLVAKEETASTVQSEESK